MPRRRTPRRVGVPTGRQYEIELIAGLERFVNDEMAGVLGRRAYRVSGYPKEGRMSISYSGPIARLLTLRSAVAVHLVERFGIPRPKALLGHEHFSRLIAAVRRVVRLHPVGAFRTFRLSVAGADSTTMRRLRSAIGAAIHLEEQTTGGHLNLSIRRTVSADGWDVLVRLTPMPLSARIWRVCNRPDALNATIARAMIMLSAHGEKDRFLNLGCGSGTLLIERIMVGGAAPVVGVDVDPAALACAGRNIEAAGLHGKVDLIRGNVHCPPLPERSFDTVATDLPFGMLANTDVGLDRLYDAAVRESARLVVQRGAFVVVTARRRLFEDTLSQHTERWRRTAEVPLRVSFHRGYIAPSIYLLRRV